ncbi:Adenylate cyclase type 10 [Hondaea fermentalgiana]|uniref:Adenylate cyclase type 10 n=1 Tax=Hondaea fermentalgiana TaxID=2315210 RepID=A0A2R5GRU9_9STRA|nr:Adenylate cyclase type 10 [Hondaea fermentalgiana]|eukprot:GBG33607.1 Adenylate cyclase type 10 [Hondaea fermentalgiana]
MASHLALASIRPDPAEYVAALDLFSRAVLYRFQNDCKRLQEPLVMDAHECVVLWIDICKFTRLAENVSPEMLGHALTEVFTIIIDLVTHHGGDVIKFCGDALLCTFRDAQNVYAQEGAGVDAAICAACKCAQAVQATPLSVSVQNNDQAPDVFTHSIDLQVKTCVAKGKIRAMLVGGAYDRWEYLVVGQPLQDLRAADRICKPSEIIVTQDVHERLLALAGPLNVSTQRRTAPIARANANIGREGESIIDFDLETEYDEAIDAEPSSSPSADMISSNGNKMMLRRRPEPLLIPCTAEGVANAPAAKTTQDRIPGALPARRNRCVTTIDLPVPLQNVAAGFARRLSPRHQGFATCQARAKSNEFLPRWKPFGPSPRNANFQVANMTPLGGTIGQSASSQSSEQDHFVLLGGHEWFEHKAPLLPSNSTLDLSAIHNAAATKARSSPAEVNKTRSTDEEHPLAGFVPFQDPSFAEMRHVTVLFIKLHGLSDRAFEEDDGTRLAKSIHKSLVVIQGSLYRYGGMLRQMLCDDKGTVAIGVFGVPGAPTTVAMRQDDVSYALVAALEIQRELAERRDILDCRASIGVATGPAFCGIIGSQQRAEYSIVGDTVNTAARIMEATGADDSRYAVACDEQTRIDCRDSEMICFDDRMDLVEYARSQYKALVQKMEDSPENPSASRSRGVQFYAVKCEAKENPLRAFFSQVLRAESPTWIADLVSVLKMRASSLLEYIELLADIFPEHRQAFTSFRKAAGHNPLWLAPGSTEREGALWAFLARLVQDIGKTRKSPSWSNKRELRKLKLSVDTSMDVMGWNKSDAFNASLVMPQLLRVTTHKTSQDRRGSGISQRRRSCTGADAVIGVSPRAQPNFHADSPFASAHGAGLDASRFSQKWNCTRRKRRSAVLGESGTPLSLTDALPRPDWIVLDNEDLDKAILSYGSEFGVFEAGPSTLLSVIFTASPSPHSPFEANFVSLLKRHHAMGRFPLRIIPVRPLGASEATLLATMLLRQSGYAGEVSEKSEALVKASCGNPARLFCLAREARSKQPDQHM